jgi:hypothetical protein
VAKRRAGKAETLVGIAILLVLMIIAVGVLVRQAGYDPDQFRAVAVDASFMVPAPGSPVPGPGASASQLQEYLPEGLTVLTPPEVFGPLNLSDKINGKAELYLSAGFVGLHCQRFALAGNPDSWVEVFIYDMGSPNNTFAVFSTQRRADGQVLALTGNAYRTANALFFAHGSDYVEIVAAQSDEEITRSMLAYAENFVRIKPVVGVEAAAGPPFPPEDLDRSSITLLAADVFGFDRLTQVYTATYRSASGPLTAFMSERSSADEARELAAAYCRFLLANGGVEKPPAANIPGVRLVQIFDSIEVVLAKGRYLLGVHDASAAEPAQQLALRFYQAIPETAP